MKASNAFVVLLFVVCCSLCFLAVVDALCNNNNDTKPVITIGGLFVTREFLENERNCLPAAQMAVDDINSANLLLPNYRLKLKMGNSMCIEPLTFYHINRMLHPQLDASSKAAADQCEDPPAVAIIGPLCGAECDLSGPLMRMYNSVQLSYGCGSATKENRIDNLADSYSNLFKMEIDMASFNRVRVAFLKHLRWQRVAVFYHSGRSSISFLDDQQRLVQALAANNITVARVENFINAPAENLARLKASNVRIIFIAFNQDYIKDVTRAGCEAYKAGIYGPRYVWITIAYISPNWWFAFANHTDCTVEQISSVFSKMFYVGQDSIADERKKSIWTKRSLSDLKRRLHSEKNISSGYEYIAACYDSVVIVSYALNKTEDYLRSINSSVRLRNFYDNKSLIADSMVANIKQLVYDGFRGKIQFNSKSNEAIVDFISVFQDQNGTRRSVFRLPYNSTQGNFTEYPAFWGSDDNLPPLDGPREMIISRKIEDKLMVLSLAFSLTGIIVSAIFAAVTFLRMKELAFKATSPRINLLVLTGSLALYASLPLVTNDSAKMTLYCSARIALVVFGCCIVLGSLFAKAFRVYMVFTQVRPVFLQLHDWKLFAFVGLWTASNMAIWVVWTILDPFKVIVDAQIFLPDNPEQFDFVVKVLTKKCVSVYSDHFTYAFIATQGSMMTFGCFLAFSTRNVRYVELNDSRSIAGCIYTVTIVIIATIAANATSSNINLLFGVSVFAITIGTAVSQSVIFYNCLTNIKASEDVLLDLRKNPIIIKLRRLNCQNGINPNSTNNHQVIANHRQPGTPNSQMIVFPSVHQNEITQ